ncbi:uncharacterized protein LOC132707196 [Cylas formicarius]|uniref:uncharacterized protein LOC132707196 n=1 Tax=Cylas formicarius TaxID=197179 RepID=UPI002958A134|nr:uncharacterized protein LOC132707196 [Cylas formicarius]
MTNSMQGIYSPLPQSLSDSDSDKEISMEPICDNYRKKTAPVYRQNGHSIQIKDDIIKIKRGASKMSTTRKVAFVCSIILCFLPIIIFLWVLPCSELHTCPVKIKDWTYQQEDVELVGEIHLVDGLYKTNLNLAILYKGSYHSPKLLKHGVLSFIGTTGAVAWDFQQETEPHQMNCTVIDVDSNGNFDCLVVDDKGLKAIETVSGQALWHAHSAEEKKTVRDLSLPVAIPDLNNDGVDELLSVFERKSFLVLSGKTGRALAYIQVPGCVEISKLFLNVHLRYLCKNGTLYEVTIDAIQKFIADSRFKISPHKINYGINENVYMAGNMRLTVTNGEDCPKCRSIITLTDENNKLVKSWPFDNAYILDPKFLFFDSAKTKSDSSKGRVNGFIVKIWQWSERYRKLRPSARIHKRNVLMINVNETYFVREISERVALVMLNDTNNIINVSYTEISQICDGNSDNCQPSYANQKDSLLIADIDRDGSKELVSYYSTYLKKNDDWRLISYLKVLRLEEELPKLYGAKK